MNFNFIRKRIADKIFPLLSPVKIFRPLFDEDCSKISDIFICNALGYLFYKYDKASFVLDTPGRLSDYKTSRIILFNNSYSNCAACTNDFPNCILPEIKTDDIIEINNNSFRIISVLENLKIYNTYIVEKL